MKVVTIIPAAGLGTRFRSTAQESGTSRKQFMLLDGEPILLHTIRKFAACPLISEIVVALREEDRPDFEQLLSTRQLSIPVRTVPGGKTRQESVANALATVAADTDLVAVHDAVRPFIDPKTLVEVIECAAENGAAIVGVVPVDTVKQVHLKKIRETLSRDRLVLAQTPQVFRYPLLVEAFQKAREDNFEGTDESSLVERLKKVEVNVVAGSDRNIKITKAADMDLARLFLSQEKQQMSGVEEDE